MRFVLLRIVSDLSDAELREVVEKSALRDDRILEAEAVDVSGGGRGQVRLGELVTNRGRAGAGQPEVVGVLVAVHRDLGVLRLEDGSTRKRSLQTLRSA